jgi:Family of unknown function (DUF6311)
MNNIFTKVKRYKFDYAHYTVLLLAFVFFILKFNINVLNVTYTDWVYRLSFDPGTELISWNYYRHTPWSFPVIGRLEGYDYPTVTGSGMTGIVSPLAIFFKIFSDFLPQNFQYFGWWLLLCYLLQGYFGLKLIKNITAKYSEAPPQYLQVLAVVFLIAAPPFLDRYGHMHMFSHFFILAALACYFDNQKTPCQRFLYFVALSGLCIGVSQYTTVMVMGIGLASFIEMSVRRLMPFYRVFLYGLGILATVLFVYYLLGGFLMPLAASKSVGFGSYSSNLNTFFNPQRYSKILPKLPFSDDGQYEGFGYLGVGFMILLLFVFGHGLFIKVVHTILKKTKGNQLHNRLFPVISPLLFMAFFFFLYALSCKIGWNNKIIYEWRYEEIGAMIFDSLRASGRFIWMPFYVIMILGLANFLKIRMSNTLKTTLLIAFLGIQLFDIQKLMTLDKSTFEHCTAEQCPHLKWKPIMAEAEHIVTLPLYFWDIKSSYDFFTFSRAASEEKASITTGYFARRSNVVISAYQEKAYKDWAEGNIAENTNAVFIGRKEKLWRLDKLVKKGQLVPFEYDGYGVLVPPTLTKTLDYLRKLPDCRPLPFNTEGVSDFIKRHADKTIFVTVSEEATFKLDATTREAFQNTGSTEFSKLGFMGAYIGVIHKGKTVFEAVDNEKMLEKTWKSTPILKGGSPVELVSAGATMGRKSNTKINGKEYSPQKRGLNFVVVNDKLEVIETADFDTYEETTRAIFYDKQN